MQPTTLGAFLAARDSRHAGAAFNQNLYAPRPPTASRQARQDRQDWGRGRHLANDAWEISAAMARCGLDVGHARLISRDSQATASTGSDLRGLQCRLLLAAAGVCRPRSRLRPWDALPGAGAGCCWSCSLGSRLVVMGAHPLANHIAGRGGGGGGGGDALPPPRWSPGGPPEPHQSAAPAAHPWMLPTYGSRVCGLSSAAGIHLLGAQARSGLVQARAAVGWPTFGEISLFKVRCH